MRSNTQARLFLGVPAASNKSPSKSRRKSHPLVSDDDDEQQPPSPQPKTNSRRGKKSSPKRSKRTEVPEEVDPASQVSTHSKLTRKLPKKNSPLNSGRDVLRLTGDGVR